MSDIEKLLSKFAAGALLRPRADVLNIVDLSRALTSLAGVAGPPLAGGPAVLADVIGSAGHLVFVLADGLGMNLVEQLPGQAFIAANCKAELLTVFPSTSTVALTSIATGEWPNRHAVTGEWTHLPEIEAAGSLLPFVMRSGGRPLTRFGITIEQAFPLAPAIQKASRDVLALFPVQFVNSISSAYFSGYRTKGSYRTLTEAVDTVIARIRSAATPTFTYVYTPRIDLEAHRHGTGHPHVRAAVMELDHQLERLADEIGSGSRIALSADHGLLDAPVAARSWVKPSTDLFASLRFPPSGDSRVLYLHLDNGAEEKVRQIFRERYGERFFLITIDEAEQIELFGPGPISPQSRSRMGDLVAISSGEDVLKYVPTGIAGHALSHVAYHSGLTPSEMRIPLVVA